MAEWTAILASEDVPINTYRVVGELERRLDKDHSIVTHDAGAPRDPIMPFYSATCPIATLAGARPPIWATASP